MEITLEKVLQFQPEEQTTYHFLVVGAGGTGGYLLPNLARQVSLSNQVMKGQGFRPHTITVIDADDVEEKNLTRQNFIPNDIGKNKAKVLATRYAKSFGVPISYIEEYIESVMQVNEYLQNITSSVFQNPDNGSVKQMRVVVIDCVDNTKTRHFLKTAVSNFTRCPTDFISSGNEERAGQVVFAPNQNIGNKHSLFRALDKDDNKLIVTSSRATFPNPMEIFPESMRPKDKLPSEESCAEHAVSAPQNIHANMTAANIIFGFVNKLINCEPISEMAVFFNTSNSSTKTYFAKKSDMLHLLTIENPKNPYMTSFLSFKGFIKEFGEISEEDWTALTDARKELVKESEEAVTVRHADNIDSSAEGVA